MIYDEVSGDYKPRFGYKRANAGIEEQVIVEVKEGEDAFKDPWEENRKEKKARVDKNAKQQQKNMLRHEIAMGRASPKKDPKDQFGFI